MRRGEVREGRKGKVKMKREERREEKRRGEVR